MNVKKAIDAHNQKMEIVKQIKKKIMEDCANHVYDFSSEEPKVGDVIHEGEIMGYKSKWVYQGNSIARVTLETGIAFNCNIDLPDYHTPSGLHVRTIPAPPDFSFSELPENENA